MHHPTVKNYCKRMELQAKMHAIKNATAPGRMFENIRNAGFLLILDSEKQD